MEEKEDNQVFLKMYVRSVKDGLIADMGDRNWRTLCVISSYMDEKGVCYPTQSQIARALGVSRQAAGKRVQKLLEYRWRGKPVITATRYRTEKGTWENTKYMVLPESQLRIFDAEPEFL